MEESLNSSVCFLTPTSTLLERNGSIMSAHASCQFQKQLLVEIVKLLELCLAALVINRELSANINTTDSHTLQEEFEKSFVQMVRLLYNSKSFSIRRVATGTEKSKVTH